MSEVESKMSKTYPPLYPTLDLCGPENSVIRYRKLEEKRFAGGAPPTISIIGKYEHESIIAADIAIVSRGSEAE